jgi:hypothetical protein
MSSMKMTTTFGVFAALGVFFACINAEVENAAE